MDIYNDNTHKDSCVVDAKPSGKSNITEDEGPPVVSGALPPKQEDSHGGAPEPPDNTNK